jgi:hypothetical protein
MQVIANNDKTMHQALSYLTCASHGYRWVMFNYSFLKKSLLKHGIISWFQILVFKKKHFDIF